MSAPRKVDDARIVEEYRRVGNIYAAGETLGVTPQTVHRRLKAMGVPTQGNGRPWTAADDQRLRRDYVTYRDLGQLAQLARDMKRTRYWLCRQARRLGLTDQRRPKFWAGRWKHIPESLAAALFDRFKKSSLTLNRFCAKHRFSQLGFRTAMRRRFAAEWDALIELKAPKQSRYVRGRTFEYRVRDDLRAQGYFVLRSAQSRTALDLVAIRAGEVAFVQCKCGAALLPKEWNELWDLSQSVGAIPVLASTETGRGIHYRQLTGRRMRRQRFDDFMIEWEPRRRAGYVIPPTEEASDGTGTDDGRRT